MTDDSALVSHGALRRRRALIAGSLLLVASVAAFAGALTQVHQTLPLRAIGRAAGQSATAPTGVGAPGGLDVAQLTHELGSFTDRLSSALAVPGSSPAPSTPGATPGQTSVTSPPVTVPGQVAVISETLKIFRFGTAAGMPLLCKSAVSVLGQVATSGGIAESASQTVTGLAVLCGQASDTFTAYVNQAIASSGQAAAINPVADPVLLQGAHALLQAAQLLGSSIAPFSPTVTGLADLLAQFSSGA